MNTPNKSATTIDTSVVRRINDLGQIVIPKSMRQAMDIQDGDSLEIRLTDDTITIRHRNYHLVQRNQMVSVLIETFRKRCMETNVCADIRFFDNNGSMITTSRIKPINELHPQRERAIAFMESKNTHEWTANASGEKQLWVKFPCDVNTLGHELNMVASIDVTSIDMTADDAHTVEQIANTISACYSAYMSKMVKTNNA